MSRTLRKVRDTTYVCILVKFHWSDWTAKVLQSYGSGYSGVIQLSTFWAAERVVVTLTNATAHIRMYERGLTKCEARRWTNLYSCAWYHNGFWKFTNKYNKQSHSAKCIYIYIHLSSMSSMSLRPFRVLNARSWSKLYNLTKRRWPPFPCNSEFHASAIIRQVKLDVKHTRFLNSLS